jgi:hypothetical protein|tara:strand:- start:397 stop:600 length:204 start_codon:yes stop_codon:yes gene_type:complete
MTTYEGIRQAQIAARHYANLLAEKSKKRISKKNSKQDKEYYKSQAAKYDEAASILLSVVNNWDDIDD